MADKSQEYQVKENALAAGQYAADKSEQYHLKEKAYDFGVAAG